MKISVEQSKVNRVSLSHVLEHDGIYRPIEEYEDTGYVINSDNSTYWINIVNGNIEPFDSEAWDGHYFATVNEITLTFRS